MTDARLPGRTKPEATSRGSFGGISGGSSSRTSSRGPISADNEPTPSALRAARRRWASGVAVATTVEIDGGITSFRGATISSFLTLSLNPPLVGFSVEKGSRIGQSAIAAGIFAISILDRTHEFQSDRFSGYGPQPDGKFTGIAHLIASSGAPVLTDALAWFDCHVTDILETGDHQLIIGEVLAVGIGPDTDDPLLNYEAAYRRIEGA